MTRNFLGSTYRMQLAGIGFAGARAQVGYLHELGIETLYVSPILAAVPASTHGYDVIDTSRLDPALGTPEDFEGLLGELDSHEMRLLIDIVPNHMAAHPANRWWWEVLRDGRQSGSARVFDIDWSRHGGRVLVPTLSRPLAQLAAAAQVSSGDQGAEVELDGKCFPLRTKGPDGTLEMLLGQHYRPAYWRLSPNEGNYRRFLNIDGLIGVRVEDPAVFDLTHRFILELCNDKRVAGVRVDHIDGLTDPAEYARRLRRALSSRPDRKVVLVEKILSRDEALVNTWPVEGTTGYEFAALAGGLFVSKNGAQSLARLGATLAGGSRSFAALSLKAKREVLERSFPASLERLGRLALGALDVEVPGHDLAMADLCAAFAEMTVRLEVYRTYLDNIALARSDRARVDRAISAAELSPQARRAVQFLRQGLLTASRPGSPWLKIAQRWQQVTGAVMAKGVEDTAAHRFNGLLSLAEVGCDPDRPVTSRQEIERLARTHRRRPSSLNATSTHDSKRNEDARARLYVISEAAEEWERLVMHWHRRFSQRGSIGPDTHDELVSYQTLVAIWPFDGSRLDSVGRKRAEAYALKAAREAGRRTAWVDPDLDYERALTSFVSQVCKSPRFVEEMGRFVRRIGPAAATTSLSLVVLKSIFPGVPDFYQGTELFESTLTDPDNRRPIDFELRHAIVESLPSVDSTPDLRSATAKALVRDFSDGRLKAFTIRALLHLRRADPGLFERGSCQWLDLKGAHRRHLVALARRDGSRFVVAVLPRLIREIAGPRHFPLGRRVWGDTAVSLPSGAPASFINIFTGEEVHASAGRLSVAETLAVLPVAVLCSGT